MGALSSHLKTISSLYISLDLLGYASELKFSYDEGKKMIFDPVRKKYILVTPEELVRQSLLTYLVAEKSYSLSRMQVERAVGKGNERFDLMIYNRQGAPEMLIECKAPDVELDQIAMNQLARYAMRYKLNYIVLTNGIYAICHRMDYINKSTKILQEIPSDKTKNNGKR